MDFKLLTEFPVYIATCYSGKTVLQCFQTEYNIKTETKTKTKTSAKLKLKVARLD